MAVRLRQQSSAWMAPHALAAQLTAQTGQIAASGPQSLLAGIASGVGAFTQGRDKRRAEATNESRYQDSLRMRQADDARQDQRFQYGAVQDQIALNNDFKTGAELAYALDPTPENKMKVDQAISNHKALSAAAAKYGGVQMPQMPQAPSGVPVPAPQGAVAPTAGTEPTAAGSYNREDMRRLADSMSGMTDAELNYVAEEYAKEALSRGETLKAAGKAGAGPSRTKSEYDEYGMLARLAKGEQDRRAAKAKPAELEAEGAARKRGELSVTAPAKAAEEQAAVAALQADLEKRGIKETLPLDEAEARKLYNDRVIEEPKRKAKAEKSKADAAARDERFKGILALRTRMVAVAEARAAKSGSKPEEDKELDYLTQMFNLHNKQAAAASDRYDFDASASQSAQAELVLNDIEQKIKQKMSGATEAMAPAPAPDVAVQKMKAWEAKNPGASADLARQMWARFKAGKE